MNSHRWYHKGQTSSWPWRGFGLSNGSKLRYQRAKCAYVTFQRMFDFCRHSSLGHFNFPALNGTGRLQTQALPRRWSYHWKQYVWVCVANHCTTALTLRARAGGDTLPCFYVTFIYSHLAKAMHARNGKGNPVNRKQNNYNLSLSHEVRELIHYPGEIMHANYSRKV